MPETNDPVQENKMGTMSVPALLVNMSVPLMLSLLAQSLYNIVDGIFVAKVSESALTATTLAYPVQFLMVAVSTGTGAGISALLSRLLGEKKRDQACRCATAGLVLSLLSSVVFIILGIFAVEAYVGWFAPDAGTAEMCVIYLRICMILCSGTFIEVVFQRFLQAAGKTFLSMVSLVVGVVINIALDPILIFGLLGMPEMGISGAAYATVIGQWGGGICALLLNLFKNNEIRFVFRGFRFEKYMFKEIYKVGFPTMIMQSMASIMNGVMNAILISFSSTAVAFFGVYFKLQNFLFMPMNGIGQALLPIVGYNYGSRNKDRLAQVLKLAVPAAVCIALLGTALFCIIPKYLLLMFSASDEMLALGIPALRIISVSFSLGAVTLILGYYASGLGNGIINMLGTSLRQVIILLPAFLLLANTAGLERSWYAFWISEAAALICAVIMFVHTYKKKTSSL